MTLKRKVWLWLILAASLILVADLSVSYHKLRAELLAETEYDARTIYGFMMATRRIYQEVFIASGLPVNNQTIGFLPAHSFSRIAKDFANWNDNGILFNNVSDRPRNPDNQADADELRAIDWFRANPKETERLDNIAHPDGKEYLLYSAPIWIEPFCLKCHGERDKAPPSIRDGYAAAYGYQVGELRGLVSIKIPTEKFERRLFEIWGSQLGKSLAGYTLLLLVIGLLIDRMITNRLHSLKRGAECIAAGDYSARLQPTGTDEICQLAGSFNRMATEVQKRDQDLRQLADDNRQASEEIERLAFSDPLTGLPNRRLLMDRLGLSIAVAQRQRHIDALLLLNLDRFKNLNDAHGHAIGDLLLIAVGGRLASLTREGDTLARLASDEFALLLQDLGQTRESVSRRALAVAEKIHTSLQLPFCIAGNEEVIVTASLGITLCPDDQNDSPQDALRRADTALHRAKEAGGNQAAFFEDDMAVVARQRFAVEHELRRAIPQGELRLYLQPQVDAQGKVLGAEVLVRWQHPERGLLPPGAFVAIAEESDLIVDLGAWVLSEACQLMAREALAGNPLRLSVNLSPRQFRQPGFNAWLRDLLAATGAEPTHLTLEITEGLAIGNIDAIIDRMGELTALGILFSVDDFGTGYSSLSYIKRLPIHELKIDKSFVQDAPLDPNDAALVETILSVAHHMRLKVVAEGVETEAQAAFLASRTSASQTIIYQGYLFGKPAPAEDWIVRWR